MAINPSDQDVNVLTRDVVLQPFPTDAEDFAAAIWAGRIPKC